MTQSHHETIGQRIARYRKANGLTAAELAARAGEGLTRSVLANLESGRRRDVTVSQLLAVSAALQLPPATLAIEEGDESGAESFCAAPTWWLRPIPFEPTGGIEFDRVMALPPDERNAVLKAWDDAVNESRQSG